MSCTFFGSLRSVSASATAHIHKNNFLRQVTSSSRWILKRYNDNITRKKFRRTKKSRAFNLMIHPHVHNAILLSPFHKATFRCSEIKTGRAGSATERIESKL